MPLFLSFSMRKFSSASTGHVAKRCERFQARSTTPTSPLTSPESPPSQAPNVLEGTPWWRTKLSLVLYGSLWTSQIFLGMCARYMMYIRSPSLITTKSPQTTCHHMKLTTWRWPHGHRVFRWTPVFIRRYQQWPTQRLHAKGEDQTGQWLCQQAIHRLHRRPGTPGGHLGDTWGTWGCCRLAVRRPSGKINEN